MAPIAFGLNVRPGSGIALAGSALGTGGGLPAGFGASSLYHDYTRQRYVGAPAPSITRASTKTVFNSAGLMSTVAAGALALSDRGLSIEESRVDSLRNSLQSGASSPVTPPPNWSFASLTGLVRTITPQTRNGIGGVLYEFDGTLSATTNFTANFDSATHPASISQNWTTSVYAQIDRNSFAGVTFALQVSERDSGNAQVAGALSTTAIGAPFGRTTLTRTLTGATTAGVISRLVSTAITSGTTGGFAIWIGLPQTELGAFATSPIPTTNAAVTRAADVVAIPSPTSYVSLAQGGAFVEWTEDVGPIGVLRGLWAYHVDSSNYVRIEIGADNKLRLNVTVGGISQVSLAPVNSIAAGATYKTAVRWAANDCAMAATTTLDPSILTDAVASMPSGAPTMSIGYAGAGMTTFANGPIKRLALWPTGPSNAELQALVA